MSRALQKYLDHIMVYANRNEKDTEKIRKELEDHLLKKVSDLQAEGLSHEDAVFGAIEDHGHPKTVGYGLRKHQWVDIRTRGTARGFIAIGPKAVGTIAIGGAAFGLFACGIVGVGAISFSVVSIAIFWSFGVAFAFAACGFAQGTVAIGLMATGLWSFGVIAESAGVYVLNWPSSPHFLVEWSYPLVYLYAMIHEYLRIWGSLKASFVFHTLILCALLAVGICALCRRIRTEQRRIGYTVFRF
ncbi:MAG: hypothetical protein GWN67_11135 [Phycisphaerae bacterium]|nr:hypothetical protein [Phycisphaerae bacterium]NIS51656.1 hypothetical protein [Phycisphaerae bacterium]NIU09247.1 hypothetical protein [Phycisphaerae bacterium]NIU56908.1 hypothetical protein [Phycisphaerae bacterium]NIW93360.1 hypothetical protein [Phycisphaerae bacterium]